MTRSVIVECWNIANDPAALAEQLAHLAPQLGDAELVITHVGIAADARAQLVRRLARPIVWVELEADAGYYEHKNRGFDASTGDIVAFIDGDCTPDGSWLSALTAELQAGTAQVVAGATSYGGTLAPLANELDFPYFAGSDPRQRFAATSVSSTPTVRNFFANNVAFARSVFAAHRYPTLPMFHGQCQVLALTLVEAGIPIAFAREARVTHAWPAGLGEWLQVRLLRGADTTQLLPHVLGTYAPRLESTATRLGPLPALAVLGMRAISGAWSALKNGPVLRGLALVAGVTAVDALGAAAAPAVYRVLGTT